MTLSWLSAFLLLHTHTIAFQKKVSIVIVWIVRREKQWTAVTFHCLFEIYLFSHFQVVLVTTLIRWISNEKGAD